MCACYDLAVSLRVWVRFAWNQFVLAHTTDKSAHAYAFTSVSLWNRIVKKGTSHSYIFTSPSEKKMWTRTNVDTKTSNRCCCESEWKKEIYLFHSVMCPTHAYNCVWITLLALFDLFECDFWFCIYVSDCNDLYTLWLSSSHFGVNKFMQTLKLCSRMWTIDLFGSSFYFQIEFFVWMFSITS